MLPPKQGKNYGNSPEPKWAKIKQQKVLNQSDKAKFKNF
jgi:hypothetical protein